MVDERPSQGNPLLLPPGQLGWFAFAHPDELHQLQHLVDSPADLCAVDLAPFQAEGHVRAHRQVWEQRIALEHRVHEAPIRLFVGHLLAVEANHPRRGLLEPADHPEGGGLTAAGRSQQRKEPVLPDRQAELVDCHHVAEAFGDVL